MNLTYQVTKDGYEIFLNGQLWIRQGDASDGFFPNPVLNNDGSINLEESAKAHIAEIKAAQEAATSKQVQLDTIEANTSFLVMMSEKKEEG